MDPRIRKKTIFIYKIILNLNFIKFNEFFQEFGMLVVQQLTFVETNFIQCFEKFGISFCLKYHVFTAYKKLK